VLAGVGGAKALTTEKATLSPNTTLMEDPIVQDVLMVSKLFEFTLLT
jgi:hypothetical protein